MFIQYPRMDKQNTCSRESLSSHCRRRWGGRYYVSCNLQTHSYMQPNMTHWNFTVHSVPQQELNISKPALQSSCTSWFLLRLTTCSPAWDYGTIPSSHYHKSNIKRPCALQPPDPTCNVYKITLMMCEHYSRQLYWDFIKRLMKHWYSTANKPPSQREDLSLVTCKISNYLKKIKNSFR